MEHLNKNLEHKWQQLMSLLKVTPPAGIEINLGDEYKCKNIRPNHKSEQNPFNQLK